MSDVTVSARKITMKPKIEHEKLNAVMRRPRTRQI